MPNQRGVAHILLLVLVLVVGGVVLVYFVLPKLGINLNLPKLPGTSQSPKVAVKTEYKNPFDKKTQYVNPFETYKNPFVVK